MIRKLSIEKRKNKRKKQLKEEQVTSENSFFYKLQNHRFWLVRVFAAVLHSVWVIIMAIGSFFAWLAAMISA